MKKIISAIIVLACVFALIACNSNENAPNTLATFQSAIDNTNPAFATINTKVTTALGDLIAEYDITYSADGSASIEYTYEKFNRLGEGPEEDIKTVYTGTIHRSADGLISGDVNNAPNLSGVSAGTSINLASIPSESVTISETGDTLTATVTKDNSQSVFGVAYSEDVTLVLTIADGKIDGFKISGDNTSVLCSYRY